MFFTVGFSTCGQRQVNLRRATAVKISSKKRSNTASFQTKVVEIAEKNGNFLQRRLKLSSGALFAFCYSPGGVIITEMSAKSALHEDESISQSMGKCL